MSAAAAPSLPWRAAPPPLLWLAALLACALPALLAYNLPPSATLLNQCVAVALWGGVVVVLAPGWRARDAAPALLALALLAAAVLWSWRQALPTSLALSALGLLAAAALVLVAGVQAVRRGQGVAVFEALAMGLLAAGVLSALVALTQVFAPGWTDGNWIAHSGLPGRAVGNLRQPNHLCSLLLWGVVAAVALLELGRLPRSLAIALVALMVFATELSASRTGAAGLLLLALWAVLDKRLSRPSRWLLLSTLALYAASMGLMAAWGHHSGQLLGAEARLTAEASATSPSPNARPNVWRTALILIGAQPWTGVGFGEFNFAWTLTALPGRPISFFDHTHNFALQLMVELGLPLALLVMVLLGASLWQALRHHVRRDGDNGLAGRAALVLVLMIGIHSQVEYPLWYAYFLLPTALAWGLALGKPPQDAARDEPADAPHPPAAVAQARWSGALAGALLLMGGALAVLDYQRVVVIYAPPASAGPLLERITAGQRSLLFAHHADYAAATSETTPAMEALGFARAPHQLLDTRLMVAWARWLDQHGQPQLASTLVARLHEFRNADAQDFFDECEESDGAQRFQCQPPLPAADWRAFLALARGG